ncbi:MAG: magnesium and cobalt transport protein CorA, partial [Nitrospirae bacterium]
LGLVAYGPEGAEQRELGSLAELPEPGGGRVLWLDVRRPSPEIVAGVRDRTGIHPLIAEDILNVGQRPKVEEGDGWIMVVGQVFHRAAGGGLEPEQVSLLLAPGLLVSFQEREGDPFDPVRRRIEAGAGRIRAAGADYLLYALFDTMVDHLFPLLEELGEQLEMLEDRLLDNPVREELATLHALRRDLILLRRAVWPLREAASQLARSDHPLIGDATRYYLRDVVDHTVHALDVVESFRDVLTGLYDLYLSSVSNRLNEVMKVLTVIATIFIPLTFIAGVYGMNFNPAASPWNMPELNWRYGYPFSLALMAAVALALAVYFRRRRWL